nr:RNA-binding protein 24-A-like [Cherax quadricarinatus]
MEVQQKSKSIQMEPICYPEMIVKDCLDYTCAAIAELDTYLPYSEVEGSGAASYREIQEIHRYVDCLLHNLTTVGELGPWSLGAIFRLHPNYIYHPSYLPTTAGLLPMTHSPINHAAALASAGQQAYFDYATAAATYPGSYQAAAATSIEPYAAAVSAASAMSQYAAAMPGYSWSLPPAASAAAAAAAGTIPLSHYQPAQPQLQEARMQ